MSTHYSVIRSHAVSDQVGLHRFRQGLPLQVSMDDPAEYVMTDFRRVEVKTASADMPMDAALQKMIHAGVRLLLVVEGDEERLLGVVTARDIMGEKPVKIVSSERISHQDLTVRHVMSPHAQITVINYADVITARVGDVVATLRDASRQHALVVEYDGRREIVRGLFSLTQIGRQLGLEISGEGPMQSFAEIEKLLNRD